MRIAHRGASGYEVENSKASLLKALQLDVDIVECDVQLTSDGIPIIRHDKLLDRTTNAEGYTWEFSWEDYCQNIRLKNGEPVPSLEEFCQVISKNRQQLYVDLKIFGSEDLVLKTCLNYLTPDKFLIGSFHAPTAIHVKAMHPKINTVLILEGRPYDIKEIIRHAKCDVLALGFDSIDQQSILDAQQEGVKVFSWTINHPREIERAKSMGVDAITSDFPDRI